MNRLRPDERQDGMILLRSARLESIGIRHAFSTARGPGGRPLDLSTPGSSRLGTPSEVLQADLDLFAAAVAPGARLGTPQQVHGADVIDVRSAAADADIVIAEPLENAHQPIWMAGVRTADCVPILLACPASGRVAAVHAGWRGLVADAPAAAIEEMRVRGSMPEDLHVAIGPAIGLDRFEIGPEVATVLRECGLDSAVQDREPRPHADLHHAARLRLLAAGVRESFVDGVGECPASSSRFFSHRRDHGNTGRHLSVIIPRTPAGFRDDDVGGWCQ